MKPPEEKDEKGNREFPNHYAPYLQVLTAL